MEVATLERHEQAGTLEGIMEYRVSNIERKLNDMGQDIREIRLDIRDIRKDNGDIRTDIFAMESKLNSRMDSKIDNLDSKLNSRMDNLDSKIDNLGSSLNSKIDQEIQDVRASISKLDNRLWLLLGGVMFAILVPIFLRFI